MQTFTGQFCVNEKMFAIGNQILFPGDMDRNYYN